MFLKGRDNLNLRPLGLKDIATKFLEKEKKGMKKLVVAMMTAAMALGMAMGASADEPAKVILVTMDGLDNHWVNVDKGASTAAEELGLDYKWLQPDKKDTALQIEVLNNAIAEEPDVICVAAVDPVAIVDTLQDAADKGIKIVYVDATAEFEAEAAYHTNNYEAARMAGEMMLKGLEEAGITEGDIGVVAFSNATQTSTDREAGFVDYIKENSDFNILETAIGNSEVAPSQDAAENFITQGAVGVYGNNEPGAVGVGNASAAHPEWEGVAIGFDASSTTLDLIDEGALYAVIAQDPYNMGYLAVQGAAKLAAGEELEETDVDSGANIVTAENSADFR